MPKERLIVFQRGHKVGELAQELFPGGINMSPGHPAAFKKAIINTEEKIKEGFPVIYEAAFQYDQVMIFLDILVHTGTGWHAYEVKSSAGISDTYLLDAALQYHVIKGTGLDISGISLVHINRDYVLEDEVVPKGLFRIVDVTEDALSRQDYVAEQIIREKEALGLKHSPKIDVGPHCREPYDCDFLGHCWKNVPKAAEKDAKEIIDSKDLKAILASPSDKIALVKLLTMRPAIPMYRGTHPYQEIPYGYSISIGDELKSAFYPHQMNPEDLLMPQLNSALEGITTIICFGQGYLMQKLFPNVEILDLRNAITEDSDFFQELKDKSELERLMIIFNLSRDKALPKYKSDAVAEHYYLEDFSDEVRDKLEDYAVTWANILADFYNFCKAF